ncbi:MAG: hypothetical protein WBD24_03980 [Candidatus Omnitrophota bacterium]
METVKNFFTGLLVIILFLIALVVVILAWPFILGIGSLLLSIIAGILLIVLIFYIVVFVGYLARQFLKKK